MIYLQLEATFLLAITKSSVKRRIMITYKKSCNLMIIRNLQFNTMSSRGNIDRRYQESTANESSTSV